MKPIDVLVLSWVGLTSLAAVFLFGFDKWRAQKSGRRISELQLAFVAAAGGWLGGLLGMWLFRHKTAKGSFQFKFGIAFLIFATAIASYLRWRLR